METAVIEKISNVARVKADYAKSSFLKCFVYSMFGNIHPAFAVLLAFNLVTVSVCYWFYVRKSANMNV